ncbi:MAG: ABC transporter permease [Actinomycetota bacterium]|nr:ABC transporter permease [Actinomycetota bacterium]
MSSLNLSTARMRPLRRDNRNEPSWGRVGLLAPALVILTAMFLLPLGVMLWRTFTDPEPGLGNLTWYLGNDVQRTVLLRTFTTAFKVTAVCVLIGYPYAYAMTAAGPRLRALLTLLVLVPFWTSLMVRTFAWIILLQDGGPVSSLLSTFGLGHVELIRTNLGVVIGMSQILLPFMVMPLFAVMSKIDRRLVQASSSLGAKSVTSFLRVWLPLSMPGVAAGAMMVFISSLGFYVTPALLGAPSDSLVSQQIYTQVASLLEWGHGGAMGVVLFVATMLLLGTVLAGTTARSRRRMRGAIL